MSGQTAKHLGGGINRFRAIWRGNNLGRVFPVNMLPEDQAVIRAFAHGDLSLCSAAIAIHRRYIHLLGVRGTPEMMFMAEVDNPVPDIRLRELYRSALLK